MSQHENEMQDTGYDTIGVRFQNLTSYPGPVHDSAMSRGEAWTGAQKIHADRKGLITLPDPVFEDTSFWKSLINRSSHRAFSDQPLDKETLSVLVSAVAGLKEKAGRLGLHIRTVPSAGALHPVETYIICLNVEGLEPGIYHYLPDGHQLELLEAYERGELAALITSACHGQKMAGTAPVTFAWTGLVERCAWKYSQRAWRYLYLDAGHCGQNLYLAAQALGLGCCTIAAFMDDELSSLLGVDKNTEPPLYLGVAGYRQTGE